MNLIQNPRTMLPSVDTLIQCRDGLTKKIKKETSNLKKARLKDIRSEIDYLIEVL